MPCIIYADIESLIRKINGYANNLGKSLTTKIGSHIPCEYSMSTIWGFDHLEDKHLYHGKDFVKKFCDSLREHVKNIIDFENKKMLPLTKEELKSYQQSEVCYICRRKILEKFAKEKNDQKVRDHCHYTDKYRGVAHSICNLR